ncbi:MAG: response regulator [Desulfovibrio sp.]|jgi:CheY-like chemotaxis protein|nr:response regulator [Desulfovibrio sp.]
MANNKKIIMAVDDMPPILKIFRWALRDQFDVRVVSSGVQALELLERVKVDLILLDIEMPGMSGFDIIKHCKADPALKDIPVIIVSGNTNEKDIIEATNAQIAGYIVKPFTANDLREKVQTALHMNSKI